jgi:hypothetical protein
MEYSLIVTIIVALITAVIGPAVLEYVKARVKKKEENDDPMYKEMESDIVINEQLQFLLEKLKCDRVWILQFHNGGHYYASGVSIKKFSFFYEVVNVGISPIREKFQSIPTSFFSRSIKEIHDNEELCVDNMNDESKPAYGLRDTAEGTGCKSLFFISLKTPNGRLHGAMGVEYVKEAAGFAEEDKEIIRETASFVSGTLALIHKFK